MDYQKLTADLIKAKEVCIEAAKGEDGGSANLDTMYFEVLGARKEKVIEAILKAGLCGHKQNYFGPKYFIYPVGVGQGNSRYRGVQAMKESLQSNGWKAGVFYKMD